MSANKKRNTQIPAEAILGSAGKNDKFELNVYGMAVCCDEKVVNTTKSNTTTQDRGTATREVTSVELVPGMSIVALDGGKETAVNKITEETQK